MLKVENKVFKEEIKVLKADNKVLKADNKFLKSTIKSMDQEVIGLTATVQQLSSSKKSQEVASRRRLNSKSASAEVALLNDNAIIRSS